MRAGALLGIAVVGGSIAAALALTSGGKQQQQDRKQAPPSQNQPPRLFRVGDSVQLVDEMGNVVDPLVYRVQSWLPYGQNAGGWTYVIVPFGGGGPTYAPEVQLHRASLAGPMAPTRMAALRLACGPQVALRPTGRRGRSRIACIDVAEL